MRIAAEMLIAGSLFPCLGYGQQIAAPPPGSPPSFHATLSKQKKQHILDGRCNVITSTTIMPQSLKDAFARVTEHGKFELANPGEQFQVTDVADGRLTRRLIFAGSCDGHWFVHYEHGGIALGDDVLIFRADSNGVLQFEWGGAGFYRAKSIDELRLAISSGKFADDQLFYW